jgi:hypothetical protein
VLYGVYRGTTGEKRTGKNLEKNKLRPNRGSVPKIAVTRLMESTTLRDLSIFCDVTLPRSVVSYRRFGTTYLSTFRGLGVPKSRSWTAKVGNTPEERTSRVHQDRSPKYVTKISSKTVGAGSITERRPRENYNNTHKYKVTESIQKQEEKRWAWACVRPYLESSKVTTFVCYVNNIQLHIVLEIRRHFFLQE